MPRGPCAPPCAGESKRRQHAPVRTPQQRQYHSPIPARDRTADTLPMQKRVAAAVLWLLAGWTAGSFLTFTIGVSPLLGPILGIAGAALFAGDPRRIIWTARSEAEATTTTPAPRRRRAADPA